MKLKSILSFFVAGTLVAGAQSQGYIDGIEYYKAGQNERAKIILDRTLNDASTDKSLANYYLGQIALDAKDNATAKSLFEKGVQINAGNAYNYVGLGAIALLEGDESAANTNFKQAQKLAKKDADVTVAIARSYYNADAVKYAKEIEKNLKKARNDSKMKASSIYILEGDMLIDKQDYGEAAGRYEMAITSDPNTPEGYVKYANAYYFVNPKFAIDKLQEYVDIHPNSALAQRELAEKNFDAKYWKKAAELYGKYIQNPNHFPEDEARYVVLLYWSEEYDKSQELADKILAADPSNFLMQRLTFLNYNAKKDYKTAAEKAEAFFKNNPEGNFTTNDYVSYAEALTGLGQDSLAVVQYEIAAEKDPENGDLLKNLSAVYGQNKDFVKAAETYDAYLKLQEEPTLNDYFGMATRYLQASATTEDSIQAIKTADLGLEYINKVLEKAEPQPYMYSMKARLYVSRNGKKADQNAIDTYVKMVELLDADPENMNPANPNNKLKLYNEAYAFAMSFYANSEDEEKAAMYREKYNTVRNILNPQTTEE